MKSDLDPKCCKARIVRGRMGAGQCCRKPIKHGYCVQHYAMMERLKGQNRRIDAIIKHGQWQAEKADLRDKIARAAISRQPLRDLLRQYDEHLKAEPPKPNR